jgi:hypothetical protein
MSSFFISCCVDALEQNISDDVFLLKKTKRIFAYFVPNQLSEDITKRVSGRAVREILFFVNPNLRRYLAVSIPNKIEVLRVAYQWNAFYRVKTYLECHTFTLLAAFQIYECGAYYVTLS